MVRGVPHISPGSSVGGEEKASAPQTRIDPGLENCYLTQLPIVIGFPALFGGLQLVNLAEAAQLEAACQEGEPAGRPVMVLGVALQAAWAPGI